jgi:TolB protein
MTPGLPLDPASLPIQVGDVNAQPDFASWRAVNVDGVVMGAVERGAQIQASVRVWDTAQGMQVVGKQLGTDAQSWRRIGHIVSDAIYESLAGETGYFDTRVIYVAESGPKANRVKRLAIMDQDGANVQYLTNGNTLALTPRFSPNNDLVAYMNFDAGNWQVYLLQLSTGQQQRLGAFGQMTFSPRFAPDGRRVAFSVEQGGATNIYALDIGSSQPVQLTSGAAIDTSTSRCAMYHASGLSAAAALGLRGAGHTLALGGAAPVRAVLLALLLGSVAGAAVVPFVDGEPASEGESDERSQAQHVISHGTSSP